MAVSDYVPPVTQLIHENSELRTQLHQEQETLRDRFAMAAMQGYLSNPNINRVVDSEQFAKNCWSFADAMMEQRDISRTCGKSD